MSISNLSIVSGKKLIKLAQNNAPNVQQIAETAQDAHHSLPFYLEGEFWVGMAFVFVIIALAKPICKVASAMIHKRIEGIKERISDSEQLLEDAQKLLKDYERKYRNAKKEAQAILEKSQKQINYIKTEKLSQLEQEIKAKEKDAADRIRSSQEDADKELTALTSELTIKLVKQAVNDNLTPNVQNKMIENSIKNIGRLSK